MVVLPTFKTAHFVLTPPCFARSCSKQSLSKKCLTSSRPCTQLAPLTKPCSGSALMSLCLRYLQWGRESVCVCVRVKVCVYEGRRDETTRTRTCSLKMERETISACISKRLDPLQRDREQRQGKQKNLGCCITQSQHGTLTASGFETMR